jgi:hypothetical protein
MNASLLATQVFMDALYATILVLVVTNQRILLAADSRKTYLDKQGVQKLGTLDKIYKTNDCYYAVCGFHEEEGRFSLHQIIHKYLLQSGSLHETIKAMAKELATALKHYFLELKKGSPALFQQLIRTSASGGEVFIVSRVDAIPTAFLIDYKVMDGATVKVTMKTWSINILAIINAESCFWRAIGNTPILSSALLSEKVWALHPVQNAKSLLAEGIKRYPDFVSGPINMLELTTEGVHWIEKTPTAPNTVDDNN